jgi:HepT-like protein
MDRLALQTLREEMLDDCRVAREAFDKATSRFERQEEVAFEGCAHQLCRMFNAFEQMGLRVAKAFENNIDDEQGWHSALLNRLAIRIDGVRPALILLDLKHPLQELKAFRHVFVHAYELELDPEKLALLLKYARKVADRLPALAEDFVRKVAREQQIEL